MFHLGGVGCILFGSRGRGVGDGTVDRVKRLRSFVDWEWERKMWRPVDGLATEESECRGVEGELRKKCWGWQHRRWRAGMVGRWGEGWRGWWRIHGGAGTEEASAFGKSGLLAWR